MGYFHFRESDDSGCGSRPSGPPLAEFARTQFPNARWRGALWNRMEHLEHFSMAGYVPAKSMQVARVPVRGGWGVT